MSSGSTLLTDCLHQAARRIGALTRQRLHLRVHGERMVAIDRLPSELGDGEAEMTATAVAILIDGPDRPGLRFILAVAPSALPRLAAAHDAALAAISGMAESLLQEMGNIGASAIANRLADKLGSTVRTTPPEIVCDRWESILSAVVGSFADPQDHLSTIATELQAGDVIFPGAACLIADRDLEDLLAGHARNRERT